MSASFTDMVLPRDALALIDPDASIDAMKSKLEINEQGHILANGMRIN